MADHKRLSQPYHHNDTDTWAKKIISTHNHINRDLLLDACKFISQHETTTTTKHKTAQLGLAMCDTLLAVSSDTHTLIAGLILPTVIELSIPESIITEEFNADIAHLVHGVKQMEATELYQSAKLLQNKQHLDNLKKMMLVIVDDIRIILLKLTRRIVRLHSIKNSDQKTKQHFATQTMDIYAQLANRLGMGQLKWQLEDLSFRYLEPETYKKISQSLNMKRKERDLFIQKMIDTITSILNKDGITNINVSGRSKHIYSIHRKIQKKKVGFNEIFDASALRILVPTIKDCYGTLGLIHATWPPIQEEFDDYISQPKPNGYQSIHTAVVCENKINVEIQIRTFDMHEASELGVAAHWKYKEGHTKTDNYEDKIATLRQIIDWQKELSTHNDESKQEDSIAASSIAMSDIFDDRIYVFSPQGHLYDLPKGATPLDFAYQIHSQVGNRCKGAKVNGKLAPLTHKLITGDQVDIMTCKQDNPSLDWLNPNNGYITTKQARSKIKSWFHKQNFDRHFTEGMPTWDKIKKKGRYAKQDIATAYLHFNMSSTKDLIAAIGAGDVHITTITKYLDDKKENNKAETEAHNTKAKSELSEKNQKSLIRAQNKISGYTTDTDMMTQIARCCKPVPGDNIIGYITKGRGITIHKTSCGNIKYAEKKNKERLIPVEWDMNTNHTIMIGINITAIDRPGLIKDITNTIDKHSGAIIGLASHVDKLNDYAYINITVELQQQQEIQPTIHALTVMKNIINVKRK